MSQLARESRMAAKRMIKAQQKAVQKEQKLIPQPQNRLRLGLLTRMNTPKQAEPVLAADKLATKQQPKLKKGILARKRPFNEVQRTLSLPSRATRSSQDNEIDVQDESFQGKEIPRNHPKFTGSKRAKTERYVQNDNQIKGAHTTDKEGYLTGIFRSPFGIIRKMWNGATAPEPTPKTEQGSKDISPNQEISTKTFCSAETIASSTDCKQIPAHLQVPKSTKQFKADFSCSISGKSTTSVRLPLSQNRRMSPPVRKVWPVSTFSLEKQPEGTMIDFDLYDEADLPFLDRDTEVGRMVSQNVIQQALDDDVMTDDDMIDNANRMLSREVEKAIKQFTSGFDTGNIRNLKL